MKIMAIRLISNKEPVMILGGHCSDYDEDELFSRIDECTSPYLCEYVELNINKFMFGIMWRNPLDKMDDEGDYFDIGSGIETICDFRCALDDIFNTSKTWRHIKELDETQTIR